MTKIVVKHYKAVKPGSATKTLVTEVVTASSETGQFLKRMEKIRISKPCFEVIDMRGKVSGECQQYKINDRVHWLDDISHEIYQRGLDQYNDVFTVGIYEAIVNGKHTFKAMREAEERKAREAKQAAEARARAAASSAVSAETSPGTAPSRVNEDRQPKRYDPDIVPFGYFKKRREERLQYVTSVTLLHGGRSLSASTRDISLNGLQVSIKGLQAFNPDDILEVEFTALLESTPNQSLSGLKYEIMGGEQNEKEVLLRLRLVGESRPEGFSDFIIDLIQKFKNKYKLDVEDDFWSIVSGLYERCYAENLMQIPFFLSEDGDGLHVDVVAATDGNQPALHFFHNQIESYDFSALALPHRLEWLTQGKELLLALYRETVGGELKIHSAANLEFDDPSDFGRFVQHALQHPEHAIFKVMPSAEHFRSASERKFSLISERLAEKSDEAATRLKARLETIRCAALMVDLTDQVSKVIVRLMGRPVGDVDKQGLHVWVGNTRMPLDDIRAQAGKPEGLSAPELIRFGYVERRREDRYLAETAIELQVGKQVIQGRTRDISTRGLSVMLNDAPDIKKGDEVKLALISLQKKRPSLNLMAVPYRVVAIKPAEHNLVMLERLGGKDEKKIEEFFAELIAKNSDKLAVDINDTLGATISRAYENIIARNQVTVPFFISKAETGGPFLQWVALPDEPLPVLEFFQMSDDYIDFSWLSDPRILLPLYQQLVEMAKQQSRSEQRPTPIEMEVYLYKDKDPDAGIMVLFSATEFEFKTEHDREAFLSRARLAEDFRIMKLMATYTLEFNKLELDAAVDQLREQSRHRASKLQEQIQSLVGYGELIDITAEAAY